MGGRPCSGTDGSTDRPQTRGDTGYWLTVPTTAMQPRGKRQIEPSGRMQCDAGKESPARFDTGGLTTI